MNLTLGGETWSSNADSAAITSEETTMFGYNPDRKLSNITFYTPGDTAGVFDVTGTETSLTFYDQDSAGYYIASADSGTIEVTEVNRSDNYVSGKLDVRLEEIMVTEENGTTTYDTTRNYASGDFKTYFYIESNL